MPDNYSKSELRASSREIKGRTAMSKNIAAIKGRSANLTNEKAHTAKLNKARAGVGLPPKGSGGGRQRRDARGRFA